MPAGIAGRIREPFLNVLFVLFTKMAFTASYIQKHLLANRKVGGGS